VRRVERHRDLHDRPGPDGGPHSVSRTATAPAKCGPYTNTASIDETSTGSGSGNVIGCGPEDNPALAIDKQVEK